MCTGNHRLHEFLIANVVAYIILVGPKRQKINELQNLYRIKRIVNSPPVENQDAGLLQAKQDIQSFKQGLPTKYRFTDAIMEIVNAVIKQGLLMNEMSYKPEPVESQSLMKYATSFKINGKYGSLKSFLADIQNSKTLYCIENLSFLNQSDSEESVTLFLEITTYFR